MSNSAETSIHAAKQSKTAHLDVLEDELSRRFTDQAVEVASLRKLNSELLERLAESKQRDLERAVLQKTLAEKEAAFQLFKEDLNRKLAKLTDENWAKDLEIESLRSQKAAEESVVMRLKAETSLHLGKLNTSLDRQNDLENLVGEKEGEIRSMTEEHARVLRETNQAHAQEVENLQQSNAALREQVGRLSAECSELEEKIAKLSEEKDSRIQALEKRASDLQSKLDAEIANSDRREAERAEKIRKLEAEISEQAQQIEHAKGLMAALEQAVESGAAELLATKAQADQTVQGLMQQHGQQIEMFRGREAQLSGEINRLRIEHSGLEKLLRESNEAVGQLRAALEAQRNQHAADIRNLEVQLQEDFQKQFEGVLDENKKFRQMLNVRDTQIETDRSNLKQWQEQLNFLDQHLRQSKDSLKKDKAEIMRLAKQLMNELQQARNHPFKEYVELAEIEISKLQAQFHNTSPLSPVRTKLEERLSQMVEQRDHLKSALINTQKQLEERIQAVTVIAN